MMHTKVITKTEQNFYSWIFANRPLRNRGQNNCMCPDWVAKACFTRVPWGGVLPIMAYKRRLRPKVVPFPGLRCMKG